MVTGSIRRARRSQGTLLEPPPLAGEGKAASWSAVTCGCWRGLSRKNQIQMEGHSRVARPRITKTTRHDPNASSAVTSDGASALPILAEACTIPCAKPQLADGVQLAMARVAVGK